MDFHIVAVMLLFYGTVKGAKLALRTGGGDIVTVSESNSEERPPKVMALVIVEDIEESEETNPSIKPAMLPLKESPQIMLPWIESVNPIDYEALMLPLKENSQIMLPWIESGKPEYDEDTSSEPNSDEFTDSDTESDSDSDTESDSDSESVSDSVPDTDSDSNYYHEDDYTQEKIMKQITKLDVLQNNSKVLRNRWLSCQKKASKYCGKACIASYKNACSAQKCKKKMKKVFKKECKRNCKAFFIE